MTIGNGNGSSSDSDRASTGFGEPSLEARLERLETKMSNGFLLMAAQINEVAALVKRLLVATDR